MILSTVQYKRYFILFIYVGAMLLGYIMTILQIPQLLLIMQQNKISHLGVILYLLILLINSRMFLEETIINYCYYSTNLYPIVTTLGFDPIGSHIIMVINMELACFHIATSWIKPICLLKGIDNQIQLVRS